MKTPILFAFAGAGCIAATANAQLLVNWDMTGLTPGVPQAPVGTEVLVDASLSNSVAGMSSSHLGAGMHNLAAGPMQGLDHSGGNPVNGELNLQKFDGDTLWVNDPATWNNGINDNYLTFTLSADAGNTLNITGIDISEWRNGAGAPSLMAMEVVIDGGAAQTYGTAFDDLDSGNGPSFDWMSFTEAISGSVIEVRFVPAKGANGNGTGNLHINGFRVAGTVIPAPGAMALLGLGAFVAVRRRR